MISILTFCCFFIQYKIWILSIADWALIILNIIAIAHNHRAKITKMQRERVTLLFIGLCLALILNIYHAWFDIVAFLESSSKLVIYVWSLFTLPGFLLEKRVNIYKIIIYYIVLASIVGILQQVIVLVRGRGSWPIYSFGSTLFGLPSEASMFNSGNIMRSRSFYSEPGYMGVHLSMLFSILLFTQKNISKWMHFFYLIGVGSTISMSSLIISLFIYAIYFFEVEKVKKRIKAVIGLAVLGIASVIIFINVPYFNSRIINFMQLKDSSAVVRTIGSVHFLTESPWYGVGPGNNANYYFSLNLGNSIWYAGGGEFYNVLVLAAVTMGYLGLMGLVLLEFSFVRARKNWKLFLVFIITQCGWGLLYTSPIWVFMIMTYVVTNNSYVQENERTLNHLIIKMPLRFRLPTMRIVCSGNIT